MRVEHALEPCRIFCPVATCFTVALLVSTVILGGSAEGAPPAVNHWAYQPVRCSAIPEVRDKNWGQNAIDRFVLGRLEREGLTPSPETADTTLVRRVTLDLLGQPLGPLELNAVIDEFRSGGRPDAYDRLVDRLLASPRYGERWARPWLDLCHYADSDGYLTDQPRPYAWRYRDWLIQALNEDMPFDQFTVEQLAGDLLPNVTLSQKLATGFLRNTLSNREGGAALEEFRVEQVIDRTTTVGTTWLGMTLVCARCHDHKYDSLTQKEFFELQAFFDNVDEINIDAPLPGQLGPYLMKRPEYDRKRRELLAPVAQEIAELQARWEQKLLHFGVRNPGADAVWDRQWELLGLVWGGLLGEGQLEGTEIVKLDSARRSQVQIDRLLDYFLKGGSLIAPDRFRDLNLGGLAGKLDELKGELPKLTRAPTVMRTQNLRQAYVHIRGDFRQPGDPVNPHTPSAIALLPTEGDQVPTRLDLAEWLVLPEHPLTARVTVNRIWYELFGRGIVATLGDFGVRGELPSHPELLDWLACEYPRRGWSTKAMHRLIVSSAVYRQSSRERQELRRRDPENRLLARQSALRLAAEQVRDTTLAAGGLLSTKIGGPSVFPLQPASVAKEGFANKWEASKGEDRYRRGLYTWTQRTSPFSQNMTFDGADPSQSCTHRERSNTPLQALTLLNDSVFFESARSLAGRILKECPGDAQERVEYAVRLCLGRSPSALEREQLTRYFQDQLKLVRNDPAALRELAPLGVTAVSAEHGAAWTGLSSVLLNVHEFITRD